MTDPLLIDFPDRFETERMLIRCPLPGDGEEVYHAIRESREELAQWLEWAKDEQSPEKTEVNVRKAWVDFLQRADLRFHLFLKGTNTLVGSSGLHRIDWSVPKFEIGYWVRTSYQGQGYISEAVEGLTLFSFAQLHANRVEIRCDVMNVRSVKVAERAGFHVEGILRNEARGTDGALRNTMVFSKIREQLQV